MKLTAKKITSALLFVLTALSFTGQAQCPNQALMTLIAEDTNTVFNGSGQGTTNTINSPYSCSSMAFLIWPVGTGTTSATIYQPCIRSRYNMYYTNVRNNVTESRYENGGLIFTLAPANAPANRIGGAIPPASGASLWDFSLYQLNPTLTHSVSICKTGGAAITSDSISVRDCWRNTGSLIYASNAAFTTGCGIAWSDPANSGHLGTMAWSISPAATWPAVFDFGVGIYYVDPLHLAPATYTVTYTFTPPAGAPACAPVTANYTFTVAAPSAVTYNPNWTTTSLCSGAACTSLTPQVTGTAGGTWSGTGVSGTQFCPATSGVGNFPVTYSVGLSATCGNMQTHTVSVTATPTLSPSTSTFSMCTGGNVGLSTSGASTYTWSPAGSLNNANSATPNATPGSTTVYTVNGTSAAGCPSASAATATVTVNNPPTITVGAPSYSMCPGSNVGISVSGANTYTWIPGGSLNNPNSATPIASPAATTIYTVSGTSAAGCPSTTSGTTTVTVKTPPTLTLTPSPSYTMCPGGSVGMNVNGANSYTWTPSTSLNNANSATPTATPTVTTVYTVNGTDASGCVSIAGTTATVTINTPVTLTLTPSPSYTMCPGGSVGMTVSGASTYTWTPSTSLNNANSATPLANPTVTTNYTVSGTDASGCAATAGTTATVTVNTPPTLTVTPNPSYTMCPGGSVAMNVSGASSYTWTPSASLSNANIANPTANPSITTNYTVNGTDASGCVSSAATTATVTVNTPVTLSFTATPSSLCVGQTTTITVSGASTYTWSANAASAQTNTVSITPAGTDTYTVNGTDVSGCATNTGTVAVSVNAALTVTITASQSNLCSGQTATLTATGATNYTWTPGGNTTSITVNPTANTTYSLSGSNGGCTGTTSITLTVTPTPTVTASSSSSSICSGTSATLTANGTATTYTWMPGNLNTSTISVSPNTTTSYTLTGGALGCTNTFVTTVSVTANPTVTASAASTGTVCAGQNTTLTGGGASTYTWNPTGFQTPVINVSPTSNTIYTVTGSSANGLCQNSNTVAVTVMPLPTITVNSSSPTDSICSGSGPVTFTAGGASTYTWSANAGSVFTNTVSVNPSVGTTIYTITATGANGCISSASPSITVNATPTVAVTANPPSGVICSGQSITYTGAGATNYTWMPGSTNGSILTVSPVNSTTYSVIGVSGSCASMTQTVSVVVNQSPIVTGNPQVDSSKCGIPNGSIATVTVTNGIPVYTYLWSNGSTADSLTGVGAGTYSVLITDAKGCVVISGATTFTVGGSAAVIAAITPKLTQGQSPVNVSFTNNTIGASGYNWNFGNGSFSSSQSPSATFTAPGTYTVIMTAHGTGLCQGIDTAYVIVDVATTVVIPNVFSPNGDGINDNFFIMTTGMKTLNCDIFNRWGTRMFTITAPQMVWDGKTPGGESATEGTYYYILSAQGYDGKSYNKQGPLTLVK